MAASVAFAGITSVGAPDARSIPLLPEPFDEALPCTLASFVPAAANVPIVDDGDPITIGVFLVLDRGIGEDRGREAIEVARRAYQPLGLALEVTGVREVELEGTDSSSLLEQTAALFPERSRPVGSDAVVTFTSVNMTNLTGSSVAGQAACVGGIRYPTEAFVVSEVKDDRGYDYSLVTMSGQKTAKIVAHELAHLLGAHHQYANCAEGAPSEMDRNEASPCTLMFNDVGLLSLAFGTLEGTVARGYASEYARP
ncbi:MAG TPA: M12 family metallo-peptidase [Acidimicrobiales bacterium]|nr:M12 family metallo-peptidase [Acidimicrobiales bacterium]